MIRGRAQLDGPLARAAAHPWILLGIAAVCSIGLASVLVISPALEAAEAVAFPALGMAWVCAGVRRRPARGRMAALLLGAIGLHLAAKAAGWAPVLFGDDGPLSQPSVSDAGLLVADGLFAGLLMYIVSRREQPLFVVLDVVTIAVGIAIVAGVALIGPDLAASTLAPGVRATQAFHVALDVALFSAALRMLLAPHGRAPATWLLLAAAFGLVGSDVMCNWLTIGGSYVAGGWGDVGWLIFPPLAGAAALHPSFARLEAGTVRRDGDLRPRWPLLLGIVSLVGPLTLGVHRFLPIFPDVDNGLASSLAVVLGGTGISALVVARFLLLMRSARRLARALETTLDERSQLLEVSEERYRGLVEQLPAVMYVAALDDGDGLPHAVYVSPQTEAIMGLSVEAWLTDMQRVVDRIHPDDMAAVFETLSEARAGDRPAAIEFRFTHGDGREVWLRDRSPSVTVEHGVRYIQGLIFDVTEAKAAEAERDRMEIDLRLAQKLESVGQLAAGIAHEINTPIQFVGDTVRFLDEAFGDLMELTAAYGELRAAVASGHVPDELVERVAEAEEIADLEYLKERVPGAFERTFDGVSRVATIVRAMREFAHPPTVDKAPVDLNEALRSTLVVAASEYKYVAEVETDFAELPPVHCNAGDINQVLLNLIVNAAHAIGDVVGDTSERGTIGLRTRVDGDNVVISVSDTGCGIPEDVAARIFDPFFTTKEVGHGTGQGLAITRTIVTERHGGSVSFETESGRGTTFHVALPTAASDASAPGPALVAA